MMFKTPAATTRKHILVCLLLLAALLGVSVAAASHIHTKQDIHDGQCALCMTCAEMIAVCTVLVVSFLLLSATNEPVFEHAPGLLTTWTPLTQRVRPPPTV